MKVNALHFPRAIISFLAFSMMPAIAQQGVTSSQILIGQACVMSGPSKDLGYELKAGAEAYFAYANAHGGVRGRKIKLISIDDGYYPQKTLDATKHLLKDEKVFALFGYVGSSTSAAALSLINPDKVPFFAPYTGAEFFRTPVMESVYTIRASYFQETELLVRELVDVLDKKNIALFYQDDHYGKAGFDGVQAAMRIRGLDISASGTCKRNSIDVHSAFAEIAAVNPDAVILVGSARTCAAFIKAAKIADLKSIFITLSAVGSAAFAKELGSDGEGVFVTQVVPLPGDASVPLVREYQTNLRRYLPGAAFGFGSLEGYLNAKVFVQGLRSAGKKISRASLIAALDNMKNFDCGGVIVSFGPQDHQGLDKVYLTVIEDGTFKQVRSLREIWSHKP